MSLVVFVKFSLIPLRRPFKINNRGGKPIIQVTHKGEEKTFVSPNEHFVSYFLVKLHLSDSGGNQRYGLIKDEGDSRGVPR